MPPIHPYAPLKPARVWLPASHLAGIQWICTNNFLSVVGNMWRAAWHSRKHRSLYCWPQTKNLLFGHASHCVSTFCIRSINLQKNFVKYDCNSDWGLAWRDSFIEDFFIWKYVPRAPVRFPLTCKIILIFTSLWYATIKKNSHIVWLSDCVCVCVCVCVTLHYSNAFKGI